MDFFQQNHQPQAESRPGFTETPMGFAPQNQMAPTPAYVPAHAQSQPQGQSYGAQSPAQNQGYTSTNGNSGANQYQNNTGGYQGNKGGYQGGNKSYGSGNSYGGGGGGYKAGGYNGGGGNWKGKGQQQRPLTPEELTNLKLPKTAAITGNSKVPDNFRPLIQEAVSLLRSHGYTVRASGMDGFDKMVLECAQDAEIHLPWKDFGGVPNAASTYNSDECKEYAKRYLPEWGGIKESHQAFYSKNVRLLLGKYLKQPCQIAIIWSEDGCEGPSTRGPQSGQAGHVAALARAMHIPVINLNNPNAISRLRHFLES